MTAVAGHFGEWLQGRHGPNGPVVLVTMCCPVLSVRPGQGRPVFPPDVIARFLGHLRLTGDWPDLSFDMPLGGGAGASTATLVAGARALGFDGSADELARAAIVAEGACDPLMYPAPDALLWASREGRVIESLPAPPACEVVGGFWGAPERTDPADARFSDVTDLVEDWRQAVAGGDLGRAARVATESARRCDALRGPAGGAPDPMRDLMHDLRALGVVRAHTGSARGLIFAPGSVPADAVRALREAGLQGVMSFATGGGA